MAARSGKSSKRGTTMSLAEFQKQPSAPKPLAWTGTVPSAVKSSARTGAMSGKPKTVVMSGVTGQLQQGAAKLDAMTHGGTRHSAASEELRHELLTTAQKAGSSAGKSQAKQTAKQSGKKQSEARHSTIVSGDGSGSTFDQLATIANATKASTVRKEHQAMGVTKDKGHAKAAAVDTRKASTAASNFQEI